MKLYVRKPLFVVTVLVSFVQSIPVKDLRELEANNALTRLIEDEMKVHEGDVSARRPRFTCDLLDGFGLGHTPCAAHCLALGRAGGRCSDSICICRKTTFGKLWRRHFGSCWW